MIRFEKITLTTVCQNKQRKWIGRVQGRQTREEATGQCKWEMTEARARWLVAVEMKRKGDI